MNRSQMIAEINQSWPGISNKEISALITSEYRRLYGGNISGNLSMDEACCVMENVDMVIMEDLSESLW